MGARILVVGAANMDFVIRAERMPEVGESLFGEDFNMVPGGKGANQAVAIAKLGGKADFVSRVGDDVFGDMVIENLARAGVRTEYVIRGKAETTGVALVVVDKTGNNSILVVGGANLGWRESDVNLVRTLLGKSDILLCQLEIPLETIEEIITAAREAGVPVVLDAGPARECPREILGKIDIISPNETEAEALTGVKVNSLTSAAEAAEELLSTGIKTVIVKLGEKGALIVGKGRRIPVPSPRVKVVDTTAAGDAFTGGFIYYYAQGKSVEESVWYGCHVGALAVTRFGSQPSIPGKEEVERFIKKWPKR